MEDNYKLAASLVSYDPDTGQFKWLERDENTYGRRQSAVRFNVMFSGKRADHYDQARGYMRVGIRLNKSEIFIGAHRLAWFMQYGEIPNIIDHANGDRTDNRISNLRNTDHAGNARNVGLSKRNTSGIIGVNYCNTRKKWVAKGFHNGRRKHLGYFDSMEDAASARQAFNDEIGYHSNHGQRDGWLRKD